MPSSLIPVDGFSSMVGQILEQYLAVCQLRIMEAKSRYLSLIRKNAYFGCAMIKAKYKGFWAFSENVLISIGSKRVEFLSSKSRDVFMTHPIGSIDSYEVDSTGKILSITVLESAGDEEHQNTEQTVYQFETVRGEEVVALLKEYRPISKSKDRSYEISPEVLQNNVIRARETLIYRKLMRIPGPNGNVEYPNVKKSRALRSKRKTSKNSIEKVDGQVVDGGTQIEYYDADWKYWPTPLSQSLSSVISEDLDAWATGFSQFLFSLDSETVNMPSKTKELERYIEQCTASQDLANEAYLQLIKITTDHPEPDGKQVIGLWKVFSVFCNCLKPSLDPITMLVKAHMSACANPERKLFGQTRIEESRIADFSLKSFCKIISAPIFSRKFAPSAADLNSILLRQKLRVKVFVVDCQFRTVILEPTTSIDDLVRMVQEKMNVKGSSGFALFEKDSRDAREWHLSPEELVCDVFSRWQRNGTSRFMSFLFKKRLFLNTHSHNVSAIEENLMRLQAIEDIHEDVFPVGEDQSTYLAALQLQSSYGNFDSPNMPKDEEFIKEFAREVPFIAVF